MRNPTTIVQYRVTGGEKNPMRMRHKRMVVERNSTGILENYL